MPVDWLFCQVTYFVLLCYGLRSSYMDTEYHYGVIRAPYLDLLRKWLIEGVPVDPSITEYCMKQLLRIHRTP